MPVHTVVSAGRLAPDVMRFRVEAPAIARTRRPGQFVIVRDRPEAERIPLTVCDADPVAGTITLVVQGVGKTTRRINLLSPGDSLADVAGPLGMPSEVARFGRVIVIGGGVGTAIAYPAALALAGAGNEVVAVVGARDAAHLLLLPELAAVADRLLTATEDGSAGRRGRVTDVLADLLSPEPPDRVMAIGPVAMMAAVADLTRPLGIPTVVSLNPIMVDGTGMCGGCRVAVGGVTRFACVDGPEFDAHQVDFALLARRNATYLDFERRQAREQQAIEAPMGAA